PNLDLFGNLGLGGDHGRGVDATRRTRHDAPCCPESNSGKAAKRGNLPPVRRAEGVPPRFLAEHVYGKRGRKFQSNSGRKRQSCTSRWGCTHATTPRAARPNRPSAITTMADTELHSASISPDAAAAGRPPRPAALIVFLV